MCFPLLTRGATVSAPGSPAHKQGGNFVLKRNQTVTNLANCCALPRLPFSFYQLSASNRGDRAVVQWAEDMKLYEAVMGNQQFVPGCVDIQPNLGLSTSATRNHQLHRRTSFDGWTDSQR